jgi:thiol-disulfide isomerase/thioredoxin
VALSGFGVAIAFGALIAATATALIWRRANGSFRPTGAPSHAPAADPDRHGWWPTLGVSTSTPLTMVQFSSAFCAPCRATRVLCREVAGLVPGVAHVEVDAESHLDAVREFNVVRTPTVLLVSADGRVVARASGAPTRTQLLSAVAQALPAAR